MDSSAKRQTAVKIWIGDLKNSTYTKSPGEWEPNFVLTPYNTKVSRVNLLGAVVESLDNTTFTLDDGTAKITIRSFEPITLPKIGDIVLVIGRVREFSDEIYILPEIIKVLKDHQEDWVRLRKLELEAIYSNMEKATPIPSELNNKTVPAEQQRTAEELITDEPEEQQEQKNQQAPKENTETEDRKTRSPETKPDETPSASNIFDKVLKTIKAQDKGDGADIQEVIEISGIAEADVENVVNNLLMDGEAFEIRPGKIKLLD